MSPDLAREVSWYIEAIVYPCVKCGEETGSADKCWCEACREPYCPDEQDFDEGFMAREER